MGETNRAFTEAMTLAALRWLFSGEVEKSSDRRRNRPAENAYFEWLSPLIKPFQRALFDEVMLQ